MKEYRTVRELTEDELEELREKYFWEEKHNKIYVCSITNAMLYRKYNGIDFVKDDFACNQ